MSQATTEDEQRSTVFEATADESVWNDIVDRLLTIDAEAILEPSEDGLSVTHVDPGVHYMVELQAPAETFGSYVGTDDRIGVPLDTLSDVLSVAGTGEGVTISLDEDTRTFGVRGEGFGWDVAGIDPDAVRQFDDMPDPDEHVTVTLPHERVTSAVEAADMLTNHLTFECGPERVVLSATGDTDSMEFEWDTEEIESAQLPSEPTTSKVSTEYLGRVVGSLQKSPIEFGWADEMPVRIEQDLAADAGHSTFMIAPRIDST